MFKRKKRSWFLYTIIFSVSLLFIINRFLVPISKISDYVYSSILYPILLPQYYIVLPIKNFFKKRKCRQKLEEIIFKLHTEKENLVEENIQLRAAAFFYDQIKEVIAFKDRYTYNNLLFSQIIFKHINDNSHFFLINKGSSHGVETNMVAVYKNFLVGKVVATYPYYSKVILITDKSCKVASYCMHTKANGIHVGNNKTDISSLQRVSHLSPVKNEDMIISSGDGLVFPQGFAIGTITSTKKNDLYYTIQIKPLFDITNLTYCFLIKKGSYISH